MAQGTPEEYEALRAGEFSDDVELEHGPHRKYDFHEFIGGITEQAARLREITEANPGFAERMDRIRRRANLRDELVGLRHDLAGRFFRMAAYGGVLYIQCACASAGFPKTKEEIVQMFDEDPLE